MPACDADAQTHDRRAGVSVVVLRCAAAALLVAALIALHRLHGHADYGRVPAWVFLIGLLFGWCLQRSRFCFFCMLRDGFENRDSRAALAMVAGVRLALPIRWWAER